MAPETFAWSPDGREQLRRATAMGLLNVMLYGEERVKANSVVRGGNRSFLTGSHLGGPLGITEPGQTTVAGSLGAIRARTPRSSLTKAGTVRVGGTLRRGWHVVVYLDGKLLPGSRTLTENGEPVPDYPSGGSPAGIVGVIGNNVAYSGFVDQGTWKMPARPMLLPAARDMGIAAHTVFMAGFTRYARAEK